MITLETAPIIINSTHAPEARYSAPRVSIIIVNWNGKGHLECCLDSLAGQNFRDFEVVLVDNGSTDGSVPFLQERYPWVRLVELTENTGFATGNNRGLAHASGEYVVTLNNDTKADPAWLAELVAVADAYPAAGMVGCRICSYDDPDIVDSLGFGICRDGMSRGLFRFRRFSELYLPPVMDILMPSACAALYRRAMLDETGFFDDDFFAYAEDTDLGLRARRTGWGAVLATNAVVLHKYSRTGGTFSPFKVYLVERNHYWVAVKNFPAADLLKLPLFTVQRYLVQARLVASGSGSGSAFRASGRRNELLGAVARGMRDAVLGFPACLAKRRQIAAKARISSADMSVLLHQHPLTFAELLTE